MSNLAKLHETETKLKPCPFCGGEANKRIAFPVDSDGMEMNMYIVGCKNCDIDFSALWDEERAIELWNRRAEEHNNCWIACSERLPEDCDNRFYMCIVENHEEDLPMFCQYDENYGFGFWHDIYDKHTLGFVDSEFKSNEELGYEKVIAWQPLPEPYKGE